MYSLVSSNTVQLTRELAERFKNMVATPTERPLDEDRVAHLRRKVEMGLLLPFDWSEAHLDGQVIRVNGQHSSNALCGLNGAFPTDGKVHHNVYNVDSKEDTVLLYRQFDSRKSSRSLSDIAHAFQGLHEELEHVPALTAKLGIESICWYLKLQDEMEKVGGFAPPKGDDRYALFKQTEFHPFLQWLGGTLGMKTPELNNIHVVAAMYGTFEAHELAARDFWEDARQGGKDDADATPAVILDDWLQDVRDTDKKPRRFQKINRYWGCVYAWNCHQLGKKIKTIKVEPNKKISA
jgi:hypothetical protein